MNKKILTIALLAVSIFNFGQNIKIKKDQLVVDKIPVANFVKEKGVFTLSKLDNTEAVLINVEYCALSNKFYIEFVNIATQSKNQKPLTSYSAMNHSKYVLLAIEESGFVNENGISDKLNDFIDGQKFDLAKEYGCTLISEGKDKVRELNLLEGLIL